MNAWPLVEGLIVAALVALSLRTAWRRLAPAVRGALRPAAEGKACGSACGGCESGTAPPAGNAPKPHPG